MLLHATAESERSPAYRLGGLVLLVTAGAILTALGFEHFGGYAPCPLCLQERYAYYAGIPLLLAALVMIGAERPGVASALFGLVALAFAVNAGLGVYHAGVEWKFWPGPTSCSGSVALSRNAGSLLERASGAHVVRCDDAPWHFLGLSFAGWNAVISVLLAIGAASTAAKVLRRA